MIEAQNIHKSFGALEVLKGIDLHVSSEEIISIVGPSGAGKSTLLHIVGTLDQSSKGKVLIAGEDVSTLSGRQLAQFRSKNIGFVFQNHNLLPEFNALENVCIPALIARKSKHEAEKKAALLLDYLGLKDRMKHKPSQLSGGELQRIAVARALVNKPKVVLADEPSGNLDSKTAEDLHQLFFNLRDEFHQTFVIVTHNTALANMSDRVIQLRDGKIDQTN